jgi:hypothetical protein
MTLIKATWDSLVTRTYHVASLYSKKKYSILIMQKYYYLTSIKKIIFISRINDLESRINLIW